MWIAVSTFDTLVFAAGVFDVERFDVDRIEVALAG
jgi:hypothetical protein